MIKKDHYEVEDIISHRMLRNKKEYLIKWLGYGLNQSTWQPIKNLQSVLPMIDRYQKRIHQQQTSLLRIHKKAIDKNKKYIVDENNQDDLQLKKNVKQETQIKYNLPSLSSFSQASNESQSEDIQFNKLNSDSQDKAQDEFSISEVKSYYPLQYNLNIQDKKINKKILKLSKNYPKLKHPVKIIGLWLDNHNKKNYIIKYRQNSIIYCHREFIVNNYYKQLIDYLQSKVEYSQLEGN